MLNKALRARLYQAVGAAGVMMLTLPALAQPANETPNLEGVWQITAPTTTLNPTAGQVPFTSEGLARYRENEAYKKAGDFDEYDVTTSRCSNPGVPRLMLTPMRFKIWNRQGVVTFDFEWNRAIRQIDLRGVTTEPALVPTMTGKSQGRWEGQTLVAVTTDISDRTLLDDLVPHSDSLKVTERFKLVDNDTLENRITIEDPVYFTRPWEAVVQYKRKPHTIFPEDVCLDRLPDHQSTQS